MNQSSTDLEAANRNAKPCWRHWQVSEDLRALQPYWEALQPDPYVVSGERLRRYGVALYSNKNLRLLPFEPHVQSLQHNRLFGGIERQFGGIDPDFFDEPVLMEMLRQAIRSIPVNQSCWRLQCHQFRILAPGKPTPEGVHCDGADYVLMVLMKRHNVLGGTTSLFEMAEDVPFVEIQLKEVGESLLIDDRRIKHHVSPIVPSKLERTRGYRDMLIITFHKRKRDQMSA